MATYTYNDFLEAARNSGYTFSDADMELAKRNPDAGMSLLKYKTDFYAATTDEARTLAHQGAENIRGKYGGYTGGGDGGSFSLLDYSYDYGAGSKPSFDTPSDYGVGEKPSYQNRYDEQTQALINAILNREPFSYDPNNDPLYAQYQKAYTREGQRATEDAIGSASAASGGIPSSYATTAAAQAGNYYAAQMADKIPELDQIAYDRYMNDYQMQNNNLSILQNAEQMDYNKYLNDLGQYNTDRNFGYTQYLNDLGQYNSDRNFGYTQYLNDLAREDQQRQEALNLAAIAYGLGDTSYYQNMGIDLSNDPAVYQRAMDIYVKTGNTSFLEALGITVPKPVVPVEPSPPVTTTTTTTTRPQNLSEAGDWIKKYYGTNINQREYKEIQEMYPGVSVAYLAGLGITVDGTTQGTVLPPPQQTPSSSSVWTPDSSERGFDQASVTIIGKRLGLGDIDAETLNDLIDAGIVEHYVANNQDRFRLVDNWETLWALYISESKPGNGGGASSNINSNWRNPNGTQTQR